MKSVYAFIHYAFGGVKAPSISVLGSSTSTTGSARRVPPPRGSLLAARLWVSPSGSSSRSLFLIRGYTSCRGWPPRLGPLSLLHWVFLLRPVSLSARSIGSGADGCAFPSAVDLVYCHRFQYVFSFSYNFRGVPAYRGGRTCFPTAIKYRVFLWNRSVGFRKGPILRNARSYPAKQRSYLEKHCFTG